jgi:hypothetical protein
MLDVKEKIIRAYKQFIKNDFYLLHVKANERSITHKLAEYLQIEFPEYHVDCEYNKNKIKEKTVPPWEAKINELVEELGKQDTPDKRKKKIKELMENGVSVYPDIIIHRRGTEDNFIVIEAKKSTNKSGDDEGKLKTYKEYLHYQNAYFIVFPSERHELRYFWERFDDQLINELIREI